jgi:cysteine desulfuration protein SufE
MGTIKEAQDMLIKEFEELTDWEEKYTKIIKYGKELPDMPEGTHVNKNKIDGCQSQLWIYAELKDGKVNLYADSDALIVKGLVALLIKVYSHHTPDEILSNPPEFLSKIGVASHLSPTRQNGLSSMLKQIQLYAVAFKTLLDKTSK